MRSSRPNPIESAKWDLESTARSHAAASLRARYWPAREGVQVLTLAYRLEINARTYASLCTTPIPVDAQRRALLANGTTKGSRPALFRAADVFAAAYLTGFAEQEAAIDFYVAARLYARDVKVRKAARHG